MSKIKQFFRQSGLTKAQLLASALCYFLCFALFLGIVVIWNPLSLSSTPTEDSQAADGPTNTGYWTDTGRYDISWYNNPDTATYGDGSAEKPYKISTAAQLAGLSYLVYSGTGPATNTNNFFSGVYFEQTANIDLSAYYWQPIGIYYARDATIKRNFFTGSYDGGNHTVSGIFTPAGSSTSDRYTYQGLFGYVETSSLSYPVTIKNIGITNSFIQGGKYIGGVVGSAYTATIINCYNTGSVEGTGDYVGGVVGYASGATIESCYNTGAVTGSSSYVGGVVGDAYASSSGNTTITNCYNTGAVTGSSSYVGGVVGSAYVYLSNIITITNCYNTGAVTSAATSNAYVGGVVGLANAPYSSSTITMTNCYNTGAVTSTATSNAYVGGVVGRASASSSGSTTITNCYNTGDVSGSGNSVGGVVGYVNSNTTITNCYYGGNCSNIGGIDGKDIDGQAKYDSNIATNAKKLPWYTNSSNWNPGDSWDFENVWTLDEGRNDGYPSFIIDYWISDPSYYSIEWFNNPDTETYGDGSASNPYIIDSAADLAGLSWLVYTKGQAGNPLVSGIDYFVSNIFRGKFFKQTANIDLSAYYWQPIGIDYTRDGRYRPNNFSGSYDGGNHIVSGIYTPEGSSSAYSYQGLFGYVDSSSSSYPVTIKNIGVTNSYIQGYSHVGGVVGYAVSSSGTITITNCYNTGSVNGGSSHVGGVVGYAYATSGGSITITNCYNTGSVESSGHHVGGVAGYADYATITNCYNTGNVTSTATSFSYVGGVVGRASGATITNCYNTGSVESSGYYVGGVVGIAYSNTTITNCYNAGSVSGSSGVGGVVGDADGTITNCYYGGDCLEIVGGINGADVDGQAVYDPDLAANAKDLSWYTDSANWNSSHPWKFDLVWQIEDGVNDGYPTLLPPPIDWWTNEGNYSIEWYNNSDTATYGDGTAENPYKISTAADLAGLSYLVYNNAVEAADSMQSQSGSEYYIFSNAYFEQTANIDLSAHVWQPIGIYYDRSGNFVGHYFSGNYDGAGFTVSGLNTPAGDTDAYSYQGLFGYVDGSSSDSSSSDSVVKYIQNLGITDSNIQGYNYVGGVVGYASSGSGTITITNCYNTGSVTGAYYVGGIAGSLSNGLYESFIRAVFNKGSVSGHSYVGGICGNGAYGVIAQAYNTGTVSGGNYIGGIAASDDIHPEIHSVFNVGKIVSTGANVYPVAGPEEQFLAFNTYYGGAMLSEVSSSISTYVADLDEKAKDREFLGNTVGFDFNGFWKQDEQNINQGYPVLSLTVSYWTDDGNFSTSEDYPNSPYLQGEGTVIKPYEISNAQDLAALSVAVQTGTLNGKTLTPDADSTMGVNIYFSDTYFVQKADIDLSTHIWQPIGSVGAAFSGGNANAFGGHYDGGNYKISGMQTNKAQFVALNESIAFGLFSGVVGLTAEKTALIKNVRLTDVDLTLQMFCGAVAGVSVNARLENCSVSGDVNYINRNSGFSSGGIVGMAMNSQIDNCVNSCEQSILLNSDSYYGGIVGMSLMSTITNCKNLGRIQILGGYIGGIVGNANVQDQILNCENYATFVQSLPYNDVRTAYFAGIISNAQEQSTILNCSNYGSITVSDNFALSSSDETPAVTGIVASAETVTISNCQNFGSIGKKGMLNPIMAAGIAGMFSDGEILNCTNFGTINAMYAIGIVLQLAGEVSLTNCNNYAEINAMMLSAGIVGVVAGATSDTANNIILITDCGSFGKLNCMAANIVGGIVGSYDNREYLDIIVSNCVVDLTVYVGSLLDLSFYSIGGIYGGITQTSGGVEHVVVSADKCFVNVNVISDAQLDLSRVFDGETRFGDENDTYTLTYTNSYGIMRQNGETTSKIITEETSSMEDNFVYLDGFKDGMPVPIKTDRTNFFHMHDFGSTTGIVEKVNDVLYPNLITEPITTETLYFEGEPSAEQMQPIDYDLNLEAGKTYEIKMTVNGQEVVTTSTASYVLQSEHPNYPIGIGVEEPLAFKIDGIDYIATIIANGDGNLAYAPGKTFILSYGYIDDGEQSGITPSVPFVITSIREVPGQAAPILKQPIKFDSVDISSGLLDVYTLDYNLLIKERQNYRIEYIVNGDLVEAQTNLCFDATSDENIGVDGALTIGDSTTNGNYFTYNGYKYQIIIVSNAEMTGARPVYSIDKSIVWVLPYDTSAPQISFTLGSISLVN